MFRLGELAKLVVRFSKSPVGLRTPRLSANPLHSRELRCRALARGKQVFQLIVFGLTSVIAAIVSHHADDVDRQEEENADNRYYAKGDERQQPLDSSQFSKKWLDRLQGNSAVRANT